VRRRARARHIDLRFARDLDEHPPVEWRNEIDQALMPGGIFKEFVFFHRASATLILTDTIMNLELDKADQPWRAIAKLSGMHHPHGQIFFGMRLPLMFQKRKARAVSRKIKSWNPQRIVLSHGRCFEGNAETLTSRLLRGD